MPKRIERVNEHGSVGRRIRVAFFDLDGTLVQNANSISPMAAAAVRELQECGVAVALATGRPLFGARHLAKSLGIGHTSLFFSGSLLSNPHTGHVLHEALLDPSQVQILIALAREHALYLELYTSNEYFVEQESRIAEWHFEYLQTWPVILPLDQVQGGIVKAVFISTCEEEHERVRQATSKLRNVGMGSTTGAAHPHILFTNVTSPEGSRGSAFDRLLSHFGVEASEVAAFGDADGDKIFLERAYFGIAMGNAPADVQHAARFITRPVEEEGVAHAVRELRNAGILPNAA